MKGKFIVIGMNPKSHGFITAENGASVFTAQDRANECAEDAIASGDYSEVLVCEVKGLAKRTVTIE